MVSAKLGERWLKGRVQEGDLSQEEPQEGQDSELGQTEEEGGKRDLGMGGRVITRKTADEDGDTLLGSEKLFG